MKNPRTFLAAATVGLVLAATGCTAAPAPTATSGSAGALQTPTVGLTYIPNVQFSPFYVAETDQLFAAAGVKPTLRHHGASEGLFTALAAGQEQFVIAGGDEMLQARAEGLDLVAVAAYYRSYPVKVIARAELGITTLADLKGHSIGIPGKYGENWFGLQVALRSAGLTDADVAVKEIGFTQQAALSTGKVDAVVGFSNNEAVQFKISNIAMNVLDIATGQVPLVGICLITTAEYAKAHPGTVKAVAAGMLAGISSTVRDPAHALEISGSYIPGLSAQEAQLSASMTLTATSKLWTDDSGKVDGHLDAAQWAAMADFMAQQGLTTSKVDPTPAFTNTFLD